MSFPPLLSTHVRISSTNFDGIILRNNPKANVNFTIEEANIRMDINFEVDRKNNKNLLLSTNFYHNGKEIDYEYLDAAYLSTLVKAYQQHILKIGKEIQQQSTTFSISKIKDNFKSLLNFNILSKLKDIKTVMERYTNIKSVNIFTSCKYENQNESTKIARTIIELDADILTIISEELLDKNRIDILLDIHKLNVYLANYLFLYPILKIFRIINTVRRLIGLLSASIWFIFAANFFPFSISENDLINFIYLIFNYLGVPTIIFKSISKIFGHIIRKKLLSV